MHLLVGLPLGLFRLLLTLVMLAVRLALPIAVIVVLVVLYRRRSGRAAPRKEEPPTFHGPVYTVDYEEVDGEEDQR